MQEYYEFHNISIFPSCMKHADVTPLHKKRNKSLKENYRSVFILPVSLKVLREVCLSKCQASLMNFKSKYQYGFRKEFGIQECLLALLEK